MILALVVSVAMAAAAPVDPMGTIPSVVSDSPFTPPMPEALALANGAQVWVIENKTLPLVSLRITVPGGSASDPVGKEGRAALSDTMMTRGAGALDADAFAEDLAQHAIDLEVETGRFDSTITVSMKRDQLDHALSLLSDAILVPTYGKKETKREKSLEVAALETSANEPVAVATQVAFREWFGKENGYGKPPEGTIAGMKAVSKKDVVAYHSLAWNAAGARITVAGDVSPSEAKQALDAHFGAWRAGTAIEVMAKDVPVPARRILVVDRPGSTQTMFYFVFPGAPIGDPQTAAARTGAIVLGGTFTSRLNHLLRETDGYTYGVHASLEQLPGAGVRVIATRIRTDATGPAMKDLAAELAKVPDGVTDAEAVKARGSFRQDQVEAVETLAGTVGVYGDYQAAGLGPDALAKDLAAMASADKGAVDKAFDSWSLDHALLVFVGDKKVIEAPLRELGYGTLEPTDVR